MHSDEPFTALGIDVGGTKIAAGLVCFPQGRVKAAQTIETRAERSSESVLRDMVQLAGAVALNSNIDALGIGLCEIVDGAGRILSANCVRWKDDQVRSALKHLGPVILEADVRAAARAEALFGAGRAFRIFLYITVGTGISSCLMIDGAPFLGARGATGTMASSPISVPCESCGEINHRTLEEIAAGPALVARCNNKSAITAKDVVAAANQGDRDALQVVRAAGEALGASVAGLVNVLDPEAVIVGGGLGLSEGAYWDAFHNSTRRHIWSDVHRELPILRAETGTNAGIIGAAIAAWKVACAK
jgi:glucokinase